MQATLGTLLFRAAEQHTAMVNFWHGHDSVETYRYDTLLREALLVAGALQQRGLRRGDRVGIVLPTHPDFYRAFFGVILAGGVPSALYPPIRLSKIGEWKQRTSTMLQALTCRAVLTDARLYGLLGYPVHHAAPVLGCFTVYELLRDGYQGTYVVSPSDTLAVVQFSAGTTGSPKPIALTHANILRNARAILQALPGDLTAHSGVSWLPLYHDMGLIGCVISAMLAPGPLTLLRPEHFVARPRIWLEALTSTRATISGAPNFAFGLCANRMTAQDLDGLDLSAWHIAFCGAETIHAQTLQTFAQRFAPVGFQPRALTPVYGLAEATLAVTMSSRVLPPHFTSFHRDSLEHDGIAVAAQGGLCLPSLGQPIDGVEIEIRHTTGQPLAEGHVGRIWVRGSGVMLGYLDLPHETQQAIHQDWLDTGDRGFLYEGNLYVCGRDKDVIIIRGRNHDPAYIEQSLEGIAGIRAGCTAAFGKVDTEGGTEQLILLVECRNTVRPAEYAYLRTQIRERILERCNLDVSQVELLPSGTLPRTSSGKIRRGEAKRFWQEGRLHPPGKGGFTTLATQTLVGMVEHHRARRKRQQLRS